MLKVLVDNQIAKAVDAGWITSYFATDLKPYIQPSTLDLPVGQIAYTLKQRSRPYQRSIDYVAKALAFETHELNDEPLTLYRGQTYLFPCLKVKLPKDLHLQFSPKSSIGRIDLSVKMIADGVGLYDWAPPGFEGEVWMEVTPNSFNVILDSSVTLTQMLLAKEEHYHLDISQDKDITSTGKANYFDSNTLILGLDVPNGDLVGYEARETNEPIDMRSKGQTDRSHFFKPLISTKRDHGKVELVKDHFYILATKHKIVVPPSYSAEMLPISHVVDDLRAHYAGYFDPGFGFSKKEPSVGNTGVLEVRPFVTVVCYDNQPIVLFRYYLNDGVCDSIYGERGNNYANQNAIKLAKYFAE